MPVPAWAHTRRQRAEDHDHAEEDDDGPTDVQQFDPVVLQDLADRRGGGAERDEHHREPGHEQPDALEHRPAGGRRRRPLAARRELGGRQPRDHGDVARHQRQDARRDEREDPGAEGDEHAGRIGRDRGECGGCEDRGPRLGEALADLVHVGLHHHGDQVREVHLGLPAQHGVRLARIADQQVDFGRAQEALVDDDVLLPVQAHRFEGQAAQLAHLVRLARRHDVIAGSVLLQHQPHGTYIIGRVAPVALHVEVAQRELVVDFVGDAGHAVRHLARHELEATPGRLVVEQDPRGGVKVVALPVVHRDPVPVHLGHAVGAAG